MKLVKQVQLKSSLLFDDLSIRAKNLFNYANYLIRQHLFQTGKWLRYHELYTIVKDHDAYTSFKELAGSHPPQQLLKTLDRDWKSFFNAIKVWKSDKTKFKERPRIPKYKKKNGRHLVIWTKLQCRVKGGYFLLTRKLVKKGFPKIPLKNIPQINESNYKGARLVPFHDTYKFEMIYEVEPEDLGLDKGRAVGLDIGVSNLVAMSNNIGEPPIVIKGGAVKSINQYFNKRLARLRSIAKKMNAKYETKRIKRLFRVRNNKIKDIFHKISRKIIDYCVENNIGTIIGGYNSEWKQRVSLGRRNNQNFVGIPFLKLIHQIQYKAKLVGVSVRLVSEEYTSQRCSSCGVIDKTNRKHRGLYVCKRCGAVMNADINASRNILRKGVLESSTIPIISVGIENRGGMNPPSVVAVT